MSQLPASVLIVEDSRTVQLVLVNAIESDARLRVAGTVHTGEQAVAFLKTGRADVVLMDIHLPGMNGFETTRQIMATTPLPIVICSAVADAQDVATTFQAVEAGALAFVAKPRGPADAAHGAMTRQLLETLRLMAEIKVVRRWPRRDAGKPARTGPAVAAAPRVSGHIKLVAIGTSTGGPPVLRAILSGLPANFPAPILIVQHIAPGFLPGLVEWLATTSALPVHVAEQGVLPLPGHVYFAPDGRHLGVNTQGLIALAKGAADQALCPSVGHLFRSVANVHGVNAIGVLLTGMGTDGAAELASLRHAGAITIAQDKASSVIHGMPGEAIRLNGATHILPADKIAPELARIVLPV